MGEIIKLTEDWVTVTPTSPLLQPPYAALDVLAYDQLDFMLYTGLDFNISPPNQFVLTLLTSSSLLSPTGWAAVGSAYTVNTDRVTTTKLIGPITGGFQRYLRWSVSLTGIATARFYIEGVGRRTA